MRMCCTASSEPRPAKLDVAHVADVEEAHAGAHGHVLGDQARILDRHIPAAEVDHLRAKPSMQAVQWSFAEFDRCRHRASNERGILAEHEPLTLQPVWVRVNRRKASATSCSGYQLDFGSEDSGEPRAPYRRISHIIPIRTSTPAITTTRIVWKRPIHLFCIAAPRPDYSPSIPLRSRGSSGAPRNLR